MYIVQDQSNVVQDLQGSDKIVVLLLEVNGQGNPG
jgi:hypothetical protein